MLEVAAAMQRHLPPSQSALADDEVVEAAYVRWTEIFGEAAKHVDQAVASQHPEIPWRLIVDTRNRIVHGYFEIDHSILWEVITQEIPKLVPQIEAILDSIEPEHP